MSKGAPASLFRAAPLFRARLLGQTASAQLSSVRLSRVSVVDPALLTNPPRASVVPGPTWVPPFQVNSPLMVRSPAPARVPPDSVNVLLTVEGVARDKVPPAIARAA